MRALIGVLLITMMLVAQQYTLTGGLTGPLVDLYTANGGAFPWGDTNICLQTAATYANGASAGTSTYNLGDGEGSHKLTGRVLCTQNDGKSPNGQNISMALYALTHLDLASPSKTAISEVNTMQSYGAFDSAGNTPVGWYGMCSSGIMTSTACDWKITKPVSVNGWLVAPVHRSDHTGYWAHELTLIASPDGGAHWCNPNSFFAGGATVSGCIAAGGSAAGDAPKCDASSLQTTLTEPLTLGATTMSVASGANITNGMNIAIQPEGSNGREFVGVVAGGGTTTLTITRHIGRAHANGAILQIPAACTNAAYNAPLHPSVLFKDAAPFNGAGGYAHHIEFFEYCQDNSCTGMPDNADTYLYGWASPGNQSRYYLFRVQKDIAKIMDPGQWQWYDHPGYSPANVGDGTSWTSTAPGVQVFAGRAYSSNGTYFGAAQVNMLGAAYNPILVCADSACSYVAPTYPNPSGGAGVWEGILSFPHPWGPYKMQALTNQASGPFGFFHLMRHMQKTISTSPFTVRAVAAGNLTSHQSIGTNAWQAYDLVIASPATGNALVGRSKLRFSMGPTAHALPRGGLQWYFDFFDHFGTSAGGGVYAPWLYAVDIANANPTAVMCSLDSSGVVRNSTGSGIAWETTGPAMVRAGLRQFQLRTLDSANTVISPSMFAGDAAWTVNLLINPTSLSAQQGIFQVGTSRRLSFEVNTTISHLVFAFPASTTNGYAFTTSAFGGFTAGAWHSLTVTKAAGPLSVNAEGTLHVYVDGVEAAMSIGTAPSGPINTSAENMSVMYSNAGSFGGKIAGLGVWNRPLSSAEVASMYQALKLNVASRGVTLP